MLIDTHTHPYLTEFDADRDDVVRRALDAGIGRLILPNVDISTISPMKKLHAAYPELTHMAMGLHPTEVGENYLRDLDVIRRELEENTSAYSAVGEIGIDLYWDKTYLKEQIDAFSRQIDMAIQYKLPVIIHCREGLAEILQVLRSKRDVVRGVFHSFGGTVEDVNAVRSVGDFYFGINGIVTFKNSKLREVLPEIGINRILLETDAPYLAPVPFRGKRNESAYMVNTAQTVASALGMTYEEVCEKTTLNACDLFDLVV